MKTFSNKLFSCIITLIFVFILCFFVFARNPSKPISISSFKLNTFVSISIYDSKNEDLLKSCLEICDNYDLLFSKTNENSELYRLNHTLLPMDGASSPLSKDTMDLINIGLNYSKLSRGYFSIALAPLTTLWDFSSDTPSVPSPKSIEDVLPLLDYQKIETNDFSLRFLQENMGIDLGGIAKGYIADRIKDYLLSQGVKSAMINLGGNVLCIGSKPDGSLYEIGIQKPFGTRNESIVTLHVSDKSIVSSGVYERYFEQDGKRYHHILDPKTGYPYNNGLLSVTIVSDQSVDGDALSTACFALGLDAGLSFVESLNNIDALFITEDFKVHYTKGFEEKYLP